MEPFFLRRPLLHIRMPYHNITLFKTRCRVLGPIYSVVLFSGALFTKASASELTGICAAILAAFFLVTI